MNVNDYLSVVQRCIQQETGHNPTPAQDAVAAEAFAVLSNSDKRWLWICGNIGSGKTTVGRAIAQSMGSYNFVKAIDIISIEKLTSIAGKKILIIDDAGKNPKQINNMGVYIDVLPYLFHMRESKGITIFTSQSKIEKYIGSDFSLVDRFKFLGAEIILTDKSFR